MDNQMELTEQYAKLKVLYETVIYLNAQIKKEHDKLEHLKAMKNKNNSREDKIKARILYEQNQAIN